MAQIRNPRAGTAGASALRVHAQLSRDRAAVPWWRPLDPGPSADTEAWRVGATGEQAVGRALDRCRSAVALHDRARPDGVGNIDHLVVGPAGIFVIDTKAYAGAVELVGGCCLMRSDYRLMINGWDRTSLLVGVHHQVDLVQRALDDGHHGPGAVPITGVLCFVGSEWRIPRRWGEADGLLLCPVWRVNRLVRRRGRLGPLEISNLAASLDCHFPPR